MRIGQYTLRKPWVKYVDVPIEEELMTAIMKSLGSNVVAEIITQDLCDYDCEVVSYLERMVKP